MDRANVSLIDRLLSFGKRFGYTSSTLNSLHLMYWFLGEYYHSKIVDWRFTLFWIIINITDIVLLFSHLASYLFFSSSLQLFHLLLVSDMIISGIYFMILIPSASNLYRKRTTQAFKILDLNIDTIVSTRRLDFYDKHAGSGTADDITIDVVLLEFARGKKYSLNVAFAILLMQFGCMACYIICTNLDLFVGYTRAKLSDPSYYLYPVYCESIQNGYVFFILLFSQMMAASPIIITYLIIPFFSIVTVSEFHRKFQTLADSLAYQSKLFAYHYDRLTMNNSSSQTDQKRQAILQKYFVNDLHSHVQFHQHLIRGITHLKPYVEFNMSVSIIMFMFFEILLLYTFILPQNHNSIMIRIKSLNYAIIICAIFLVNCLSGKLFSDMEDMFRGAVYDIPWYHLSPSKRQLIHILLHRAHMKIEFKALKVYSMNMELFLKFWQHVYSVVNVLRKVTT